MSKLKASGPHQHNVASVISAKPGCHAGTNPGLVAISFPFFGLLPMPLLKHHNRLLGNCYLVMATKHEFAAIEQTRIGPDS